MDQTTVNAVEDLQPMDLDREAAAMVFARSDAGPREAADQIAQMARTCERAGALLVVSSDEEAAGRMLITARRLAYPALERRGSTLPDDVGVPLDAAPALLAGIAEIAAREGPDRHHSDTQATATCIPRSFTTMPTSQRSSGRGGRSVRAFASRWGPEVPANTAWDCSSDHTLGGELGDSQHVHRAVKHALDPDGILNPGKAI